MKIPDPHEFEALRELQALREQNRLLKDQLKHLIRTERRLHLAQREAEHQLARVDGLNAFLLAAGQAGDVQRILELALELVCSLFSFEQGVGLLFDADPDRATCAAMSCAPGLPSPDRAALERVGGTLRVLSPHPYVGTLEVLRGAAPAASWGLGELVAALRGGGLDTPQNALLVVPLSNPGTRDGAPFGALVLRRATVAHAVHEPLATIDDVPFLQVVAQQVSVAVANARLLRDLKESYETLALTQEELIKRERLAALGELAAVMAHEVRNPLGVIFNSLSRLQKLVGRRGEAQLLMGMLSEEADRLNRIVGDLLDFARPNAPQLRPVCLQQLVGEAVESATAALGGATRVAVHHVQPLRPVAADARMLRQVFINLVTNALQATSTGGEVRLRLGADEDARMMEVEVQDDGPGIPSALQARLFQPFFTTKAAGTGLGLAVCKRFVDAHQGQIHVESDPGKGARFTVRLPAQTDATGEAAAVAASCEAT